MEQEYITQLLQQNKYIEDVKIPNSIAPDFDREHEFSVRGVRYKIEWWTNICYLYIDEVIIPFGFMELSGTWPNRFKTNIQFMDRAPRGVFDLPEKVCIIPLEEWKSDAINATPPAHHQPRE